MNRRSFLKSFFVVAGVATVAPEMLLPKSDSITEEIGSLCYNPMTVGQMAAGFAMIQKHDFVPSYMFVHPRVYKEFGGVFVHCSLYED